MSLRQAKAVRSARWLILAPATILAAGAASPSTREPFRVAMSGGPVSTVAGAHSDVRLRLSFPSSGAGLRHLRLQLPEGLVGNPNATSRCPIAAFTADRCTPAQQVGELRSRVDVDVIGHMTVSGRIYNLAPRPREPARLGIVLKPPVGPAIRIQSPVVLRADYGIDSLTSGDIPRTANVGIRVPMAIKSMLFTLYGRTRGGRPFMTNPTRCGPAAIGVEATSWAPDSAARSAATSFDVTDCDRVPFTPHLSVSPRVQRADRPTAMAVTLGLPGGRPQSTVRSVAVTLPAGATFSPGIGAHGLAACSDARFALRSRRAPTCPARSRIGSVRLATPLLGTLVGGVFLGTPRPGDPLRLLVHAAKGDVATKLAGRVKIDPRTGRITTTFAGLPQIPFSSFTLAFRGGGDAPIQAPPTCGPQAMTARLEPYARPGTFTTTATTLTTVDCRRAPFAPTLASAVDPSRATADTHMTVKIARGDDEPLLDRMRLSLPTGLLGHIADVPACPAARARSGDCPAATRVGTVTTQAGTGALPARLSGPIYFTTAGRDRSGGVGGLAVVVPARVGPIDLGRVVVGARLRVRPDLGIDVDTPRLPARVGGVPLAIRSMTLALDRDGFVFNASSCAPKTIRAAFTARDGSTATATAPYRATGCDRAAFAPTLAVTPTRQRADAPTPLTVAIGLPARAQSTLRSASVVLPEGTALSPGVGAHGLAACADGAFGAGTTERPSCPARSRIGAVSLVTPLLGRLAGDVYLGAPTADAPLRLFAFAARDGILVKLVGRVAADPGTGRLTTTFDDLPEVPFTSFRLTFRGGDDAVLKAPPGCGTHRATARLRPFARPETATTAASTFTTTRCARRPLRPALTASVTPTNVAADARMTMAVARADDAPRLDGLRIALPSGLLGRLTDVPACPLDAARAGTCPADSRVGTTTVSVGTGAAPATLAGSVSLTTAPTGALAGLAIVVDARVGPIDLGRVVVLARLQARADLGIDVVVDHLPRVVAGVPLALRAMTLTIDRGGFLVNATSCAAQRITATFTDDAGARARASVPYRARGCAALPFAPRLSAVIGGTIDAPSLTTTIALPDGSASLAATTLTLPRELAPDAVGVTRACPLEEETAGRCPAQATVGTASAVSPLLPAPLSGPVRLVIVPGRLLPSLAVDLGGALTVQLRLDTDTDDGRLRATVVDMPDVPLASFTLELAAGRLLASSRSLLCAGTPAVDATFTAHTGATATASATAVAAPCGP